MASIPRTLLTSLLLGSTALFSLLCHPAQADTKRPRLALVPYKTTSGVDSTEASWINRLFGWALRQRPRLEMLNADEVDQRLNNASGPDRQTQIRIKLFKNYLDKAKKLYKFKRYDYTVKALDTASKLAPSIQDWVTDHNLFFELYLYYGLSYLQLRDAPKTRENVIKAAQLDPERQLDESEYPAQFINYFQAIQNWVRKNANYSLTLKSVPEGAQIYYNFRLVGRTPFTVSKIPLGRHLFRMTYNGYKTWSTVANFDKAKLGKQKTLQTTIVLNRDPKALTLEGIPIFDKAAAIDPLILERLEAIREKLEADQIFIVEPYRKESAISLRIATYKKDAKTILYRDLPIGSSREEHRPRILAYAQEMEQQLAPPPAVVVRASPPPVVRREDPPPERRIVRREDPPPERRIVRREDPPPERRAVAVVPPVERPEERSIVTPPAKPAKSEPFHQTWWFWTLVGVVVVGGGTALAVVLITQNSAPPSATFIVTTSATTAP